jgi:hypothetical protein
LLFGPGRHGEQFARPCDVGGAVATGQQPVVTDAVEARGQHMHQEAPDELVRRERHGFPAARTFDAIVLPAERHATIIGGDEPAIGDGDPVGVSRQLRAAFGGWTVFNWFAARDDVHKRIAELEARISGLREQLRQVAKGTIESTKAQRILDIREQELERTKLHAEFIEYQITKLRAKIVRR